MYLRARGQVQTYQEVMTAHVMYIRMLCNLFNAMVTILTMHCVSAFQWEIVGIVICIPMVSCATLWKFVAHLVSGT